MWFFFMFMYCWNFLYLCITSLISDNYSFKLSSYTHFENIFFLNSGVYLESCLVLFSCHLNSASKFPLGSRHFHKFLLLVSVPVFIICVGTSLSFNDFYMLCIISPVLLTLFPFISVLISLRPIPLVRSNLVGKVLVFWGKKCPSSLE